MTITAVGSLFHYETGGVFELPVSPTAVGDILVTGISILATAGTPVVYPVSGVSGGGVTTWYSLADTVNTINTQTADLWWGVITATGSSTITYTVPSALTNYGACAQQFHSSVGTTWSFDGANYDTPLATSGNYPPLTPTGSGELYVALGGLGIPPIGGATAGFTYYNSVGPGPSEQRTSFVFLAGASTPTVYSPAWTVTTGPRAQALSSGLIREGMATASAIVMMPSMP